MWSNMNRTTRASTVVMHAHNYNEQYKSHIFNCNAVWPTKIRRSAPGGPFSQNPVTYRWYTLVLSFCHFYQYRFRLQVTLDCCLIQGNCNTQHSSTAVCIDLVMAGQKVLQSNLATVPIMYECSSTLGLGPCLWGLAALWRHTISPSVL